MVKKQIIENYSTSEKFYEAVTMPLMEKTLKDERFRQIIKDKAARGEIKKKGASNVIFRNKRNKLKSAAHRYWQSIAMEYYKNLEEEEIHEKTETDDNEETNYFS